MTDKTTPGQATSTGSGPVWMRDRYGWNLYLTDADGRPVHAWIAPRPPYCDRGRWQFGVDGIEGLDWADSFPRYYMELETAKREALLWLNWRLFQEAPDDHS